MNYFEQEPADYWLKGGRPAKYMRPFQRTCAVVFAFVVVLAAFGIGGQDSWNGLRPASALQPSPSPPADVAAYRIGSQRLEVRWTSSVGDAVSSFTVQWKSGAQPYDASRRVSVVVDASVVVGLSDLGRRRHAHTIVGLTDGTEYTVQVVANSGTGTSTSSLEVSLSPNSSLGDPMRFLEHELVRFHEGSHPWVRAAWDYLVSNNVPVEFTPYGNGIARRCFEHSADNATGNLMKCEVASVGVGRLLPGMIGVSTHELAHVYTLATAVASPSGPIGFAHLYVEHLLAARAELSPSPRDCSAVEIYADALTILVHPDTYTGYWHGCFGYDGSMLAAARSVMTEVVQGMTPSWVRQTYGDPDPAPDLENLWSDVIAIQDRRARAAVVHQLRNEFGGYCHNRNTIRSAFSGGATRNPWRDSGCVPTATRQLDVTSVGDLTLRLSWAMPAHDGGAPILGYKVQWKSGADPDDTSRQEIVLGAGSRSHAIAGLNNSTSYDVRVLAYNANGDGIPSAEATAVVSTTDIAAPRLSGASIDGALLTLQWNELVRPSPTPPLDAFTVTVNETSSAPTAVVVAGDTLVLELSEASTVGDDATVSYRAPTDPAADIQDLAGNAAAAWQSEQVRNMTTEVEISSVPQEAMTYRVNNDVGRRDRIDLTVEFSEPVTATGRLQMLLRIGSSTRSAVYRRGSGSTVLTFGYLVRDGDIDIDGVSLADNVIAGPGTIRFASDETLASKKAVLGHQPGHKVDGRRPTLVAAEAQAGRAVLTLRWDQSLDDRHNPPTWAIYVEANGTPRQVDAVRVVGDTLEVALSSPLPAGARVTVEYEVDDAAPEWVRNTLGNYADSTSARLTVAPGPTDPTGPTGPTGPAGRDSLTTADDAPSASMPFSDLDGAPPHYGALQALAADGIFEGTGCSVGRLCPLGALPRWEAAVWLVRMLDGTNPEEAAVGVFDDADAEAWWAPYVERLAELQVTHGCSAEPTLYCPDGIVTRSQMASFLVRAFELPEAEVAEFSDTVGSVHRANIDALYAARVTVGCRSNPPEFCPERPTTRAQMAAFLHRAQQSVQRDEAWRSSG